MRIAYNDIISKLDSSKLTCATVNPNYPISNVQDQRLGLCSMMASTSSIIIDFTGHGYKINTIPPIISPINGNKYVDLPYFSSL